MYQNYSGFLASLGMTETYSELLFSLITTHTNGYQIKHGLAIQLMIGCFPFFFHTAFNPASRLTLLIFPKTFAGL